MKQIATLLRRHWLPLLALNSALLAASTYATIHAKNNIPPTWKAYAKLNLPAASPGLNASMGVLGSMQNPAINFKDVNPLEAQLAILNSETVTERVWVVDPEKDLYSKGGFKKFFTVTAGLQSTLMEVEVQGSSPEIAHKRIQNLLQVYQQRLHELRRDDANAREQFAQDELQKAQGNLIQAQTALSNFQKTTGLTNIEEQTKALVGSINSLKTTHAQLVAQAEASATQAQAAAAVLRMTPQQAMDSLRLGENSEYQTVKQKIAENETALAEARGTYTDNSPRVQSLLQTRQELQNAIAQQVTAAIPNAKVEEIDTTISGSGGKDSRIEMIAELVRNQTTAEGLQQQARQIQNQTQKLNSELNFIAVNQAILLNLQRRYEIADGVYKGIFAQAQQAKTNPFSIYPNVQALEAPTVDLKPIRPNSKAIALGGILAAFFGSTALIFFLEARNPLLKPKDLQQVDFPILGGIPRLKRPNMEKHLGAEIELEIQRLASAILMREKQCLMVTSATSGEGKTTITMGLALALVNFGFRVLIVDADLRRAGMSQRLGHPLHRKNAIKQTPICIYAGLDLMPAPFLTTDKIAEFFARGSFEERLQALRNSGVYDYILVDSPPVGLACETNLISAVVRHVLFVVRSGTSDRYPVMDSLEQLTRHNAQIMGVVVNGINSSTGGYRYGYGRQRELQETEI